MFRARIVAFWAFVGIASPALVSAKGLSPLRPPQQSAALLIQFYETLGGVSEIEDNSTVVARPSVLQSRNDEDKTDWSVVPETTEREMTEQFQDVRDTKVLHDGAGRDRRVTWLYPDDGCYARAELMVDRIETHKTATPMKIFAFGNLSVQTQNSPTGNVTWWYHVAPVLRIGKTAYVLDPAIEPKAPITVAEWVRRMGGGDIRLSVCSSHAYDPNSPCESSLDSFYDQAVSDEGPLLDMEWSRIQELGRDPNSELGEHPPWHSKAASN